MIKKLGTGRAAPGQGLTTRQIKTYCPKCGFDGLGRNVYIVRLSRHAIATIGTPKCPIHDIPMIIETPKRVA